MIQDANEEPIKSEIKIDFRDKKPVTEQIHAEIRERIERGRLSPGDRLPTVRWLAEQLKVNFNTVARAYRLLDQEGLITTRQGRGTFVLGPREPFENEAEDSASGSPTPAEESAAHEEAGSPEQAPDDTKAKRLERVAALVMEEIQQAGLSLDEVFAFLKPAPQQRMAKNRRRLIHRRISKTESRTAGKQPSPASQQPGRPGKMKKQLRHKKPAITRTRS